MADLSDRKAAHRRWPAPNLRLAGKIWVDPGRYCSRVVIPKLPFPSPADPVIATHAEFLQSRGLEPFALLTLPKAGLKLAQLVGRLVRREGDSGDILVLDKRLQGRSYGKQLMRSTPYTQVYAALPGAN